MIQNMRDLGGIRTMDGRQIRKGMLIRSANLADERYLRAAWVEMGSDYIHEKLHIDDIILKAFREIVLTE